MGKLLDPIFRVKAYVIALIIIMGWFAVADITHVDMSGASMFFYILIVAAIGFEALWYLYKLLK